MLYVKLKESPYGTLQDAFLFHRLLSDSLKEWRLNLNDYDQCVAKKLKKWQTFGI